MIRALRTLLLVLVMLVPACPWAQEYTPKPGETIMKLTIQGRGNIFVKLFTKEAPKATGHIIDLVKSGFYDGQRFHKVVRTPRPFVAQIGDPASRTGNLDDPSMGSGGSGARIPYEETGFPHEEGAVALASPPNDKDGGDSQFFFVLESSKFLDGKYTVFGKVVEGIDVMRTIQKGDKVESASILTK